MTLFTKLYILCALSFAALAAQIPVREKGPYWSYSPPDRQMITCTPSTKVADQSGRATWFEPGLGNCGWWNNRDEKVLAISKTLYDQNQGGNCGQWVEIVDNNSGRRTWGKIVDSCPSCGFDDLDLSPALFQDLDGLDVGVLSITWHFLPNFNGN